MKVPCYHCDTVTTLDINFEVKNFVCPSCQSLYHSDNGELRLASKFNDKNAHVGLKLGEKGILKGLEYTITGFLTKKAYGSYYWKEYILQDKSGGFVYLSEADGHWILLKEVEDKYEVSNHPRILVYNEIRMNLYDYTDTEIVSAQGFFDFEIPKKKVHTIEYINSPYIISIEESENTEATFFGEHISKAEVKKAFPSFDLPSQTGTGLVQPFFLDVKNSAIVFCVIAILILCSHGFIYNDRVEKNVLNSDFSFQDFNNKEFVSSSFVLEGGSAPMTVFLHSDVDNSWANVQVALINEKTNDEVYANKDIEYYHGNTDGESWSEGDISENFNICGVSAGKYHLTITPQRAPEDTSNNTISVDVVWNQSSMRNVWMTILFMGILVIGIYFLNLNFEKKRWEESRYSPYDE
jgi:hypothetical protein